MKDKEMDEVITLRGTVAEIIPKRGSHPHQRWLVSFLIDEVISGEYVDEMLHFFIHSPTKSGIVAGGRYVLQMKRIQAKQYKLQRVTSCQKSIR